MFYNTVVLAACVQSPKTSGAENVLTLELIYGDGNAEAAREARGTLVSG